RISSFLNDEDKKDDKEIASLLDLWLDTSTRPFFDRFTFGEVKSFFQFLTRRWKPRLLEAMKDMDLTAFRRDLIHWGENRITLRQTPPNPVWEDFEKDVLESRIQ